MSSPAPQHRAEGPPSIACAVVTVSDTRTLDTDTGGQLLANLLTAAGHQVMARKIIPDEPDLMRALIQLLCERADVDAVLLTGGTGISSRDQTFETISALLTKPFPGYGEVFRMISYQEIGAAAILSRAIGGLIGKTVVLTMPGSPAAVRLAMEKIIVPELSHMLREARR